MFIVFEGIDGCGKDTIILKMKKYFENNGKKVKVYNNIDNGVLASEIRHYLSNGGISSYILSYTVLANIIDTYRSISKDIEDGYVVLCSRWTMSSIVYGSYKNESNFNKIFNIVNTLNVTPDITIYLDVKPDIAMSRIVSRGGIIEKYDDIEKLTKISNVYGVLLNMHNNIISKCTYRIDANETVYNVYNNVKRYLSIMGDTKC